MIRRTLEAVLLTLAAAPLCAEPSVHATGATGVEDAPPSRALLHELAGQPRLAGTIGSKVGAEIVRKHLEAAGWKVEIDEREVLLSLPRSIEFGIFADADAKRAIDGCPERIERFDADAIPPGDVPKYNAWSASGRVRAAVVDAGFGTRADFERLKALGLDLAGKVALVRYGRCYRGIKVDLATQFGCAAVLLFSDPASDGPGKGPTWPAGPWKPDWDAQRGSILPIEHVPGDPSTPGWPSPKPGDEDAKRIAGAELDLALPKIPCLPIGSREALLLIERLKTVHEKRTENGVERDVEQHLGPGPVEALLVLDIPRERRTIRNVIARLAGTSDKCVIAGAHRDSWVRGANDDGAGTVALLRAAQRLGAKVAQGWKPRDSILFAFWDAEEYGLLGSTEWGEANSDWLREYGLVYVNADTGVSGPRFSGAGGTPGMLAVLKRALVRIAPVKRDEGETPANLWEEWNAALASTAASAGPTAAPAPVPDLGLPGSGSDFAVFVHHLSIPSLEISFDGGHGGQYHTTFDDPEFVERYLDPGYRGHEKCGELLAELTVELTDAGPLVLDPVEAALTLAGVAMKASKSVEETDAPLAAALRQLVNPFKGLAADVAQPLERRADFADLGDGPRWTLAPEFRFYRALERAQGLDGRPWFKNDLWAPGLEDGYGSESFPMLRAASARGPEALQLELESLVARIGAARPEFPR